MSFKPESRAFEQIDAWGHPQNPLAAFEDYHPFKTALRWFKPSHTRQHLKLILRRRKMHLTGSDLQAFYRNAVIDHELNRWRYLKKRKAWFIPPWHWEKFAEPDCKAILDVGCGDGDVTHRIAETVADIWTGTKKNTPLKIVGLDLNRSRIENAMGFARSPHENIDLSFQVANAVKQIPFPDLSFDYTLATGVFEALDDSSASSLLSEISRVTRRGVYIEDPADYFPGGFARKNLGKLFQKQGFKYVEQKNVLSEPFRMVGRLDPCWKQMTMPIYNITLVWAEK